MPFCQPLPISSTHQPLVNTNLLSGSMIQVKGGKHKTHGPNLVLHLVLSGPTPCFYPVAAPSSFLLLKEQLHLYSPKITFSFLKATARLMWPLVKMSLTPLIQVFIDFTHKWHHTAFDFISLTYWLISLSKMSSKLIHIVANGRISFVHMAEIYIYACVYTYMHIYLYTQMHIYAFIHMYVFIQIHIHVCVCMLFSLPIH